MGVTKNLVLNTHEMLKAMEGVTLFRLTISTTWNRSSHYHCMRKSVHMGSVQVSSRARKYANSTLLRYMARGAVQMARDAVQYSCCSSS